MFCIIFMVLSDMQSAKKLLYISFWIFLSSCGSFHEDEISAQRIVVGAEQISDYLPLIQNKRVGIVANHTALVHQTHLVDTLLRRGIEVKKIFTPEHGFRGKADAGEYVTETKDPITQLPLISLYGKNVKPKPEDLTDIDIVIFDIQDVGVRFFTYISTMFLMMQACQTTGKTFLILDRPNPNGFYIGGPILDMKYKSFVGMLPIPIVYGLTVGELAVMIKGEGWLSDTAQFDLRIVKCLNYTHDSLYVLPVKPSPNLPDMRSIYLYPALGLFEGTPISVGRGTAFPFQVYGHPDFKNEDNFSFIPRSLLGFSKSPPFEGKVCYGVDLRSISMNELTSQTNLNISYLLNAFAHFTPKGKFFNAFFLNLSGTTILRDMVIADKNAAEIQQSWEKDLTDYKKLRKKYLLYP